MRLYWALVLPFLWGCDKSLLTFTVSLDSDPFDEPGSNGVVYDPTDYVTSNDVLERAYQLAVLEWTPVNPVPKNGGGYYPKGKSVRGVPYSSVKEINTYLFHDVSYHTFMTAVHNPKSVLYTEDISKSPYHGLNCAPYYGAVCSSTVMYALGINIPYYANQITKLPYMKMLENQVIDSLRVCDVIWQSGHVQMIFEIERRADTLYRISTFESSGTSAHISDYSTEQFRRLWRDGHYVGYRYEKLLYSEVPRDYQGFDPVTYNEDLCPSKGDRSVYRTTDTVLVNILSQEYDKIVLKKDTLVVASDALKGDTYEYSGLFPGVYSVFLRNDQNQSAEVSFEVIDTNVSFVFETDGNIRVSFYSSAKPEYVALCDLPGNSKCYPISPVDESRGFIIVPEANWSEYYCKVVFKGEYGRIINKPIRVN